MDDSNRLFELVMAQEDIRWRLQSDMGTDRSRPR